jgi:hypothetical protein
MGSHHAVVVLIGVSMVGGCSAGAQLVRKDREGGEVAVWGPVVPATQHARHVMVEHCGGRYAVHHDDFGLGNPRVATAHPDDAEATDVPDDARVVSYRCVRPTQVRSRNTMAFLRGGFER